MLEKGSRIVLTNETLCRKILAFTKTSTKDAVLPEDLGYYHLEGQRSNTLKTHLIGRSARAVAAVGD